MNIQYYFNKNRTIGVARYDDEVSVVPGFDDLLVLYVLRQCSAKERTKLLNTTQLTAYASTHGEDEFDPEIGKSIVRDKLVIRDAERNIAKVAIMEKYLKRLADSDKFKNYCGNYTDRMNRAYERMERYQ